MLTANPHGAFDHAGLGEHELFGACCIADAVLSGFVEFSPSCAFSIEQGLPTHLREPVVERRFWNALLFEIVEGVVDVLFAQPNACFFDAVAVGNAVNRDGSRWCHP